MLIFQRILPFLSSLVTLAIFEFLFFSSAWGIRFAPFILMIPALFIWMMLRKEGTASAVLNSILLVSIFLGSYMSFYMLLELETIKHFLNLIVVGGMFLFMEQLYFFWHRPSQYQAYALEYTCSVLNILSAFFFFAAAFGFYIFVHASVGILTLTIVMFSFVLGWLMMWINKIEWKRSRPYVLAIALMVGELFWVLHFLPVSFMVLGLVLTTMIYLCLNLSRWQLTSALDRKILQRYFFISSAVLLLSLGTARWS